MKILNKLYPHLSALAGFILVSIIYFYPVLQGKQIYQSDIAQYTGMAKEQNDFRAVQDAEPYWTNSSFIGMPTYQLGANYPHDYIGKLDNLIRFLPRPADYLFLYFLSFYALMLVLRVSPLKAFFGALAFGLSTYLIIILGVGHNAKAHAIGYMPLVVAGVILVFRRKYVVGGLLTMIAAALEINANHFQMTYYLLILLLAITVYYIYKYIKNRDYKTLVYSVGVFVLAGLLALGANAANLLATAEYTDFSMRGKSELKINADGSPNSTTSAMDYDYITEYSYGVAESLNLIAPRLFGGSNGENVGTESESYNYLINMGAPADQALGFVTQLPTYWGDQPIVAAPAYIGAVVFFLAVLALFTDKRKIKYAFLAGAIISLMLSWGKNFSLLTDFFINYVPLYDKFRAVSSIQIVLELCFPVLAIMGLQSFFTQEKDLQWKSLWRTAAVTLGLVALLFIFKNSFSFTTPGDERWQQMGPDFIKALVADRKSLYSADLLRSGFLIFLSAGILWLYMQKRLAHTTAVVIVGIIMVGDLYFVDRRYVKADENTFISRREVEQPFQPTEADTEILKDTSDYRVYEIQGRLQARTSYFHRSVGGYSAVRPRRVDQLFEYHIENNLNTIIGTIDTTTISLTQKHPVLNALNVKYIILATNQGTDVPILNPHTNGSAWFVSEIKTVSTPDEEISTFGKIDSKKTAIINQTEFGEQVKSKTFIVDSLARITVSQHEPNYIKYNIQNSNPGFAVFSEAYYANGWNAYIDGNKVPHVRTDYILRGLNIPAGKHVVEFKFEPQVVKTGGTISLLSSIVMLLLLAGGIYYASRSKEEDKVS
jgi:hypothetical protein